MEFDVFLQKAGIDAEKTLKRFAGKAGILEKFILKFPNVGSNTERILQSACCD